MMLKVGNTSNGLTPTSGYTATTSPQILLGFPIGNRVTEADIWDEPL